MKQHKQNKVHKQNNINFVLFLSYILDLTLAVSITLLANIFLLQFIFIKPIYVFIFVTIAYYFISYSFYRGTTFGKSFFDVSIKLKTGKTIPVKTLIKREFLFKFGFFGVIPILIMFFFGWCNANIIITYVTIFNIIIAIIYWAIKKELWWNSFANSKYTRYSFSNKKGIKKYVVFTIFIGFVYVLLLVNNNFRNKTKQSFLGFNIPFKKNEYPINDNVAPYIDFLKNSDLESPKDYILHLFEKNDIVILSEANHLEDTQWEMIYSLVSDSFFIKNVGTIFTEYGNVKNQSRVNSFLQKKFNDDSSRYKSAATLMSYKSGGFYSFMNKLNILNESLSDSLKLNLFFTDIMPWSYLIYDLPPVEQLEKRDSLMASIVVDWYNNNKKKCLVITNYRHAFILNENKIKQESSKFNKNILQTHFGRNEAQYMFNKFTKKVTNVMIYGDASNFLFLPVPIQNGKWRTAFRNSIGPIGFNYDNSPFGEDLFDFYPMKGRCMNIKYKDVFEGLVYYRSKEDLKFTSQLYSKYAAQQEYNKIINKCNIDKNILIKRIKNLDNDNLISNSIILDIYLNWYYYIGIILFLILTSISLSILIIDFFFKVFGRSRLFSSSVANNTYKSLGE